MFSEKIMHAWGLEKLLVDTRAEHKCIQQFSRPQKCIIFLENLGTLSYFSIIKNQDL